MARNKRFEFRATPEELERLRLWAERTQRTESDLIRTLLEGLDAVKVNPELPVAMLLDASLADRAALLTA